MGAGGVIIILKSVKQTLSEPYTATAPVRVWHTLVAALVLGFVLGKLL